MIVRSKEKKKEFNMLKQSMHIDKPVDKECISKSKDFDVQKTNKDGFLEIEVGAETPKLENSQVSAVIQPKSFRSWKKVKSWWDLKTKPQRCFLIEMIHFSGAIGHYITPETTKKFKIGQNTYIVDTSCTQPNITSKLPMLRYHEGFALPYTLKVDIEQMHDKAAMESPKTQMSYYPDVLTGVIKSEYVKGVIAGGEVTPMLKKIFIVGLLSCIGTVGCLVILLTGSNILEGVL